MMGGITRSNDSRRMSAYGPCKSAEGPGMLFWLETGEDAETLRRVEETSFDHPLAAGCRSRPSGWANASFPSMPLGNNRTRQLGHLSRSRNASPSGERRVIPYMTCDLTTCESD